jgi:F-type H+-transporting ATPase subunit epsilon
MAIGGKLTLRIVTPDQAYSHEVDEVVLPGTEGDFGVLPGHTPFFTSLRTGQMWFRQGADRHYLAVSVGFVEVLPDSVSVLSQVAQRAEDLDQEKVEAGMNRAKEMLGPIAHDMDFEAARLALLRTMQQLQAESRRRAGHV